MLYQSEQQKNKKNSFAFKKTSKTNGNVEWGMWNEGIGNISKNANCMGKKNSKSILWQQVFCYFFLVVSAFLFIISVWHCCMLNIFEIFSNFLLSVSGFLLSLVVIEVGQLEMRNSIKCVFSPTGEGRGGTSPSQPLLSADRRLGISRHSRSGTAPAAGRRSWWTAHRTYLRDSSRRRCRPVWWAAGVIV